MMISFCVLPSTTILVFYWKLYSIATRYKRVHDANWTLLKKNGVSLRCHRGGALKANASEEAGKVDKELKSNAFKDHKAAVMIGVIVFAYLLFYLPSVTVYFIKFSHPGVDYQSFWSLAFPWLFWLNSGANPVIYLFLSSDFRKIFKMIFCTR